MNLLNADQIYSPNPKYPWAMEAWRKQQQVHWLPEEVLTHEDIQDWKRKLSANEKNLLTQIFRFFTQADIEVFGGYMSKYLEIFQPLEIRMMLASFSNMETIHIVAYAHLIETLNMPDVIFSQFLEYKEMLDKHEYLQSFNMNSKPDIALTLAVFGAFSEGLQLFASFAILLNFPRHNKMKGMGQIVTWSVRDETLHTLSIIKLFHVFIKENPEIWTESLRGKIYNACTTVVHFEDKFIELAFQMGSLENLTANDVKRYIRYVADMRLNQLGLEPVYMIDENPLPWLDKILNGIEHVNFFENRATEYSKSSTTGTWKDVFANFDKNKL
ncbi:MAG: ribonucleotide-diphosphate reductase subunit beta [Pseudomonadota bacterium]